jgi:non-canonical purine NTP pyrophosphatase (RdgB/HAM1 family)
VLDTYTSAEIVAIAESAHGTNPSAFANCVIAYSPTSDAEVQCFEGLFEGRLVAPRGNNAFGFDDIFVATGSEKPFAEMSADEKAMFSPRGQAIKYSAIWTSRAGRRCEHRDKLGSSRPAL